MLMCTASTNAGGRLAMSKNETAARAGQDQGFVTARS
jgi:hypothetical protein